tara:strand:+ start:304 stop:693 length:390 start_codon:yes stop_codon:yes gene_type:complete
MQINKIILAVSIVMNGILLAAVLGPLPFLLYLSVIIHVASFWYLAVLLKELNDYNRDIIEMATTCQQLQNHIESVHEMEMFYGEPVLQELIDHTRQVNDEIDFYAKKYILDEEEVDNIDSAEEETEEKE